MRLFIAEKPSLARAIADVLPGSQEKKNGYFAVGQDIVTWCYGHLLELAPPKAYNDAWAKWDVRTLPYRISEWKLVPKDGSFSRDQLKVIGSLLKKATSVVNAGDPDREGQMLVDEVLEHYNWTGKTLRLLLNATDPESSRKALAGMKDNAEFRNLYVSAQCRSRADWLVGMNLTVAATKMLAEDNLVSVGRVQTPTLALVVRRDLEIENFKPRSFWNIEVEVQTAKGVAILRYSPADEDKRIWDKKDADKTVSGLNGLSVTLSVKSKESSERPPKLFTLPSFQREANKQFKWPVQKSLDVLQKLYEMQLTTYPRTDCDYMKSEQKGEALRIAQMLLDTRGFDSVKPLAGSMAPRDYIYDSSKVEEHHAIVTTSKKPDLARLKDFKDGPKNIREGDLLTAYNLVAQRFLMSLLPDYRYIETAIWFEKDGRVFIAKGEAPLNMDKSWRVLMPKKTSLLPNLPNGTQGKVSSVKPVEGKTTPPDHYTEGELLADMGAVAKFVDDPKIKAILKETSGIGTAATQAGTIETLKKRGFVAAVKDNLISTPFGRSVVAALPQTVKDPGLTAVWEDALKRVALGDYDANEFMRRIDVFVERRIDDMKGLAGTVKINPDRAVQPQSRRRTESSKTSRTVNKPGASR
jgi:DNA topoisomerase-3